VGLRKGAVRFETREMEYVLEQQFIYLFSYIFFIMSETKSTRIQLTRSRVVGLVILLVGVLLVLQFFIFGGTIVAIPFSREILMSSMILLYVGFVLVLCGLCFFIGAELKRSSEW